MKTINIINTLVTIENVMGIYRNCYLLKKSVAYLVKLRILFELCIILCNSAYFVLYGAAGFPFDSLPGDAYSTTKYYALNISANGIVMILLSCYNTDHFKEFVVNIEAVHELYKNSITYQNTRKTQCKRFYIDVSLFFVILTIMVAYSTYDFVIKQDIPLPLTTTFFIHTFLEVRFCFENFVFSEFIKLIVAPLKFLNDSVSVTVEKLRGGCGETEYDDVLWEIRGELEKWGEAIKLLGSASDRLSDCFGTQIAVSFLNATLNYILLLYQGIIYGIHKKKPSDTGNGSTLYGLITFVLVKLLVVVAGQRAKREAEQLNRSLIVLLNFLVAIPGSEASACARDTAALARRLRAAPLRVRLLSSITVQMTLVTGILAIVANYTIVLLQFNHVV